MSNQPKWKTIQCTDYSRLQIDETGQYAPELEIAQEISDCGDDGDDGNTYQLFRFPLETQFESKVENDDGTTTTYITFVENNDDLRHPIKDYQEWFIRDLSDVAKSVGRSRADMVSGLLSTDPLRLAHVYEDIGGYHGYANFDSYPIELTERELNKRFSR